MQKFQQDLLRSKFNLITDHKPSLTIFQLTKGIPETAVSHLQRLEIIRSAYDYAVQFKPSAQHANADGLFLLPVIADKIRSEETDDKFLVIACAV